MTEPLRPLSDTTNAAKEAYQSPQFKYLGKVESFTQGGPPDTAEVFGRLSAA